jgi:pimeloyl-ACP methyl ester carboxylesterase
LLISVVVVGIWAWTPDRSRADLEARYLDASSAFMNVAGTPVRVRDTGPKSAPVLIFMHGFGSSLETWEPWARLLSDNYHVVLFDFPGSGLSEPDQTGDYSDARSLNLVKALMQQMGIERAVLIGNSMGGRIAWKFAAAYPTLVSKLVLISPDGFASPGFDYGRPPKVPAILQLMQYFLPKPLVRTNLLAAYAYPARLSDAQLDRYYQLLLAPGNRRAMLARMRQTLLEQPEPLLQRIEAPTLLLWGEADHMIPYSNAADYLRALPNAQLVSFPDLGHVPQEESPDESVQPLERFLTQ